MNKLFISLILICFFTSSALGIVVGYSRSTQGGALATTTLGEFTTDPTPNTWFCATGAAGTANSNDTSATDFTSMNVKNELYRWYVMRMDVFGTGTHQIPVGTPASAITSATLTLKHRAGRAGDSGEVIQASAIDETFAWSAYTGDGVSYDNRNSGSTESDGVPATTAWTDNGGTTLLNHIVGSDTINLTGSDFAGELLVFDATAIVKYWCDNPSGPLAVAVTLSTVVGATDVEFYTDLIATEAARPVIEVNP